MTILIIILGILTLSGGIVALMRPQVIFGFLHKNIDKPVIRLTAIIVRLVLGALLIGQARLSKFPVAIELIGWLAIVAAIFLIAIGRTNFNRLVRWALSVQKPLGCVGGVLAIIIGVFIIYAFI